MYLTKLSEPVSQAVLLAEVKANARVDQNDEDGRIVGLMQAAEEYIATAIGRCLTNQQWLLTLNSFKSHIYLPMPPCQSVDSISYRDTSGTAQTLDPSRYDVIGLGSQSQAMIMPAIGQDWPDAHHAADAVQIRFTAGYGDSWNAVPEPLRHAVIAHTVAAFDYHLADLLAEDGTESISALIDQYKVWAF